MARILWIVIVLAAAWSLWWLGAGYMARSAIAAWFDEQAARGWQADYADLRTTGYPFRHRTRIVQPALADPATGVAWRADWLSLESPAARPGQQVIRFPATPQRLSHFDETYTLAARDLLAELRVKPAARFQVERLALRSAEWTLAGEAGPLASGEAAVLGMVQTGDPQTYEIRFDVPALTMEQAARGMIEAGGLPDRVETLTLDTTVAFSRPWDLTAISDSRPQPRRIALDLAEMRWGDLLILAAGRLDVDAEGLPTGRMTLKAENWREMLAIAVQSGALPRELADPVETTLTALSRLGGNPNALDITIGFRNGRMSAGLIPLGPAPRLRLR